MSIYYIQDVKGLERVPSSITSYSLTLPSLTTTRQNFYSSVPGSICQRYFRVKEVLVVMTVNRKEGGCNGKICTQFLIKSQKYPITLVHLN